MRGGGEEQSDETGRGRAPACTSIWATWCEGRRRRLFLRGATLPLVAGFLLTACATRPAPSSPSSTAAPLATLAPDLGKRLVAENAVVTSAPPLASDAGVEMLRQGGNAVDAAVATAFAVSVGEPQMSGIGGGGGMLIWLQEEGHAEYVDFYSAKRAASFEGLPADSTEEDDLRVVAVPGMVAGLLEAHERFGLLPRETVLGPAIRLAEDGFPVNQVLAQLIARDSAKLARYPEGAAVLLRDDHPLEPGEILRQPRLAATLRRIAAEGRDGFAAGPVAESVVRLLNAEENPTTLADLAEFTPRWKHPLCGEYRGRVVLSAPPPQSGMQIIHTLELLEPFALDSLDLPTRSGRAFDVLTSALRVGIVDHRVNDDPNWAAVPAVGVASEEYARERIKLVGVGNVPEEIEPGDPFPFDAAEPPPACEPFDPYREPAISPAGQITAPAPGGGTEMDGGETTHISVVDPDGNAVALTQTNSSLFGSGARVAGFFLNDSGFRFSADSVAVGRDPWRTRKSTISPTIILRDGRVEMVVGAPGGGRIPTAMVQSIVYVLDYGLDPLEALRMPRIFPSPSNRRVQLENGFDPSVLAEARQIGYEPDALSFGYARLYMIARRGDRWIGVADPRHDGGVRGY